MLTNYERVQTMLLASLVGTMIADSGERKRKAKAMGIEAITQALNLIGGDLVEQEKTAREELERYTDPS